MNIIPNLDARRLAPLPPPNSPESKAYRAAYGRLTDILQPKLGTLEGVYTMPTDNGDTLVARLPIDQADSDSPEASVWVWDEPWWRTFVVEVKSPLIDDAQLAKYCEGLIQWHIRFRRGLKLSRLESTDKRNWAAGGFDLPPRSAGMLPPDETLLVLRETGKTYIAILTTSPNSIVERFPPLTERLAGLSDQRLLDEVGGGLRGPFIGYPRARDAILMGEIISRGFLDERGVHDLLAGHIGRDAWWYSMGISERIDIFETMADWKGQLPRYAPALMKFVLNSPSPTSPGGDDTVAGLILTLEKNHVDLNDWTLALLSQGRLVAECLSYLGRHATGERTLQVLSRVSVPDRLEPDKAAAIARIKERLGYR